MRVVAPIFGSLMVAGCALAQTKPLLDFTFPPRALPTRPAPKQNFLSPTAPVDLSFRPQYFPGRSPQAQNLVRPGTKLTLKEDRPGACSVPLSEAQISNDT